MAQPQISISLDDAIILMQLCQASQERGAVKIEEADFVTRVWRKLKTATDQYRPPAEKKSTPPPNQQMPQQQMPQQQMQQQMAQQQMQQQQMAQQRMLAQQQLLAQQQPSEPAPTPPTPVAQGESEEVQVQANSNGGPIYMRTPAGPQ